MKYWSDAQKSRYKARQERKKVRKERLQLAIQDINKNSAGKTPEAVAAARRKVICESNLHDRAKLWSQTRKNRLVLRCMRLLEREEFKKKLQGMSQPERLAALKLRADRKIAERKRRQTERMRTWPQWKKDRYNRNLERMEKRAKALKAKQVALEKYIAQHGGPPKAPRRYGYTPYGGRGRRALGHRHFGHHSPRYGRRSFRGRFHRN